MRAKNVVSGMIHDRISLAHSKRCRGCFVALQFVSDALGTESPATMAVVPEDIITVCIYGVLVTWGYIPDSLV